MRRRRIDPGAWAKVDDDELAGGVTAEPAAVVAERARQPLPRDPSIAFAPERTHVSGRRVVAHLADGVVIGAISLILLIPGALISNAVLLGSIIAAWLILPIAYFTLTQRGSGRSPGKRLLGIRVVDASGAVPSTQALLRRSLPLPFEFIYVPAFISMMVSHYRQRLGDRWGHTYVISDSERVEGDPAR